MGFVSVLNFAQQLIQKRLQPGEIAIDATVGTGADTLYLARTVGARGTVYGFDIQQEALDQAQARLEKEAEAGTRLAATELLLRSHAEMAEVLPAERQGKVGAAMFNLGYLPGAEDLSVMTVPASTLTALRAALSLLRPKGILTAILYPGHEGGGAEALAVEQWAGELPVTTARVILYRQPQRPDAPYLIAVEKI